MADKDKKEGKREEKSDAGQKPKAKEDFGKDFKYRVRVAGVVLDGNQGVITAITKIRGVGLQVAKKLSSVLNVERGVKLGDLSDAQIGEIEKTLKDLDKYLPPQMMNRRSDMESGKNIHLLGPDLEMALRGDIDRQKKMKSYKGIRHSYGLPVRGQRTRSSFRHGDTIGVSRKKQQAKAAQAKAAQSKT